MITLEDRQTLVQHIETVHTDGARLRPACGLAGISVRTLERWRTHGGLSVGDRRPEAARPTPAHALTEAERASILAFAKEPRFADQPPARICQRDTILDGGHGGFLSGVVPSCMQQLCLLSVRIMDWLLM